MNEKRMFHRFPARITVKFRSAGTDEALTEALVKDVSGIGLQIITKQKLLTGQILFLSLDLPEGPTIIQARVVWVGETPCDQDPYEYMAGLSLTNTEEYDVQQFVKYYVKLLAEKKKGL